ncbi:ABC-type Fe3+-siderophore transport system permease subunit [Agrobacterium larrymoorei]|uniref:ABC-type Fe3+-siderophore transport system permease subunit n=1 Tax=Agrobacterium larrymoorei TaxID=160699 RepID=A0AAJ2B6S8_9HYPH|nr:iron ABC transporter permease [Agrobacterium larrymoorei]MDR6100396.1 ABC-type Fe3+-siderophore transport system permease subunit [Agrobacterium larrymoorei]
MKRDVATGGKAVLRLHSGLQINIGNLKAGLALLLLALVLAALSVSLGNTDTGLMDLLRSFMGGQIADDQAYALWTVRLPRILLGFMAGWSVALAGAMLQSVARNPLADPGLFGLSQGSMTTIMLLLVLMPAAPKIMVAVAAVGGGLAVAFLLIALVGRDRSSGLAILLMGIAIESALSSVSSVLLLYTPAETSLSLADWMAGSLFQANWQTIFVFVPLFAMSLIGIFLLGRALAVFDLGNEMAMALGETVKHSRPLIIVFAVLLSASSVTAVGPLTFLGVIAPHLASFISPAVGRAKLLLSALTGGILVVTADTLSRGLLADTPMPIGLALTLIGVPLFILTLRLQSLRRTNSH